MKSKLTKLTAMAGLAAFLVAGVGANVAQAKEYRYQVGEPYGAERYSDGSYDQHYNDRGQWNRDHHKNNKKNKKNKKRSKSYWGKFDNKSKAERSHAHMRAESTNG